MGIAYKTVPFFYLYGSDESIYASILSAIFGSCKP